MQGEAQIAMREGKGSGVGVASGTLSSYWQAGGAMWAMVFLGSLRPGGPKARQGAPPVIETLRRLATSGHSPVP